MLYVSEIIFYYSNKIWHIEYPYQYVYDYYIIIFNNQLKRVYFIKLILNSSTLFKENKKVYCYNN